MARARFIIEADVTDPPPDYLEHLDKVVRREAKFMLGNSAEVVRSEWVPEDDGRSSSDWIKTRIALSQLTGRSQLEVDDIMKEMMNGASQSRQ